jgi:hypothetical protein
MSLLFIDGFEWNPQTLNENMQPALGFGKATQVNPGAQKIAGRRAGSDAIRLPAVNNAADGGYGKTLDAAQTQVFMGAAFRAPVIGADNVPVFWVRDTTTNVIIELVVRSDGTLDVLRNSISIGATQKAIAAVVWNHVEWRLLNSTSAGIIEVRVNGVGWLSLAGVNTRLLGGDFKSYGIGAPFIERNRLAADFDDFYIANAAGTMNNTWIGDARVDTLRPTGPGANTGFTPTPAGANWQNVDEADTDLTDYVQSTATGQRDTYAYADLPAMATPSILGVQAVSIARKTDAGAANLKHVVRVGSINYPDATAQPLLQLAGAYLTLWERNPNGNVAWTESAVNNAEFGVESA